MAAAETQSCFRVRQHDGEPSWFLLAWSSAVKVAQVWSNHILPGCCKTGTVKKRAIIAMPVRLGTRSAWCGQRLTLVIVLLGNLESLCASQCRRGSWGAQQYVLIKSLPQHLCLQGIKPGRTEHREAAHCDACVTFLLQMQCALRATHDKLPPFSPRAHTECVLGIAELSSSNVGRGSWSITDLHWRVLLFLQQNLVQSLKSKLFSQDWPQSRYTFSVVWRKCSEALMTCHLYFLTYPSLSPNKTKNY